MNDTQPTPGATEAMPTAPTVDATRYPVTAKFEQYALGLHAAINNLRAENISLLARVAELEGEKRYNHDCLNTLAAATGTLGEKSEDVVATAIKQLAAAKGAVEELKNSTAHLRARKLEYESYYRTCQIAEEKQMWRKINALVGQIDDNEIALTACAAVGLDGKEGQ